MSNEQAIWLAGVFDSRLAYRQRKGRGDELHLYVRSEALVRHVQKLCGGGIAQHGQGWRWVLSDARKQRDVLARVEPYMLKSSASQAVQAEADRRSRHDGRLRANRQKRTAK